MRVTSLASLALSGVSAYKNMKQKMIEDRLAFDKEILLAGYFEDDYDSEWEPWDLEDEELQARMRKLAARMDHDRDGFVDRHELTAWGLVSIFNMAGHDGRQDYDLIDQPVDWDTLVMEEHAHEFKDGDVFDPNQELYREYNKMYNRDNARYQAADIDKDGELSLGEFVLFKNPLRDENVKAVVLERALNAVDTDKDGRISMTEFLEDWHQKPKDGIADASFVEAETMVFNQIFDRDEDEYLEGDELLYWLSPDNAETAVDEAEHLIDMCDNDEDDLLVTEEIVECFDLFIDSAVTEYAAQLKIPRDEL